jgi:hypothetical protein
MKKFFQAIGRFFVDVFYYDVEEEHWATRLQRKSAERQAREQSRSRSYSSRGSGIGRGPDVYEDWS